MNKPKVAIVGVGRWGRNVLRTLDSLSDLCEISSVVFSGSKNTEQFLDECFADLPRSHSIETVLGNSAISHVFICTPIDSHYSLAKQCLLAGKHVFVEKPLSESVSEVEELHELAQEQELNLTSGYIYLFESGFRRLKHIINESKSVEVSMNWDKWGTFDSSIVSNLLVHEIALATNLIGPLTKIEESTISENQLAIKAQCQSGKLSISIDRENKNRQKVLKAQVGSETYKLEAGNLYRLDGSGDVLEAEKDTDELLRIELRSFLQQETPIGVADRHYASDAVPRAQCSL